MVPENIDSDSGSNGKKKISIEIGSSVYFLQRSAHLIQVRVF